MEKVLPSFWEESRRDNLWFHDFLVMPKEFFTDCKMHIDSAQNPRDLTSVLTRVQKNIKATRARGMEQEKEALKLVKKTALERAMMFFAVGAPGIKVKRYVYEEEEYWKFIILTNKGEVRSSIPVSHININPFKIAAIRQQGQSL